MTTNQEMTAPIKREIRALAVPSGMDGLANVSNGDVMARRYEKDPFERNWIEEALAVAKAQGFGDDYATLDDILPPPAHFSRLDEIIDECPALSKNINAMAVNVGGLGHKLVPLVDVREDETDSIWKLMQDEQRRLASLFENFSIEHTTTDVFEMLVRQLWSNANSYWEIIRATNGRVLGVNPIEDPKRMRLTRKEKVPHKYLHRTRIGTEYEEQMTERRFRKFVLLESGGKKRYFRQYGDNRPMDARTGKYGNFQSIPLEHRANEILHFKIPHTSSEYGVVPWISVMVDAICVRVAKLCNLDVLDNSGTPPLVIVASGTDDDTFETRVRDQLEKIKGQKSRTKVLILTLPPAEAGAGEGETVVQPKLELHPLGQLIIQEGMFMNFMRFSDAEIRSIFRIPPLLLGDLEETPNKATAEEAKKIAEEQVFAPARRKIEDQVNRLLMDHIVPNRPEKGVMYWKFALTTLSSDRTEVVLQVVKEMRESGAITPNQSQAVLAALLPEYKLEALPEDPRNDIPLIYQQMDKKAASTLQVEEMDEANLDEDLEEVKNEVERATGLRVRVMEVKMNDADPYALQAA